MAAWHHVESNTRPSFACSLGHEGKKWCRHLRRRIVVQIPEDRPPVTVAAYGVVVGRDGEPTSSLQTSTHAGFGSATLAEIGLRLVIRLLVVVHHDTSAIQGNQKWVWIWRRTLFFLPIGLFFFFGIIISLFLQSCFSKNLHWYINPFFFLFANMLYILYISYSPPFSTIFTFSFS